MKKVLSFLLFFVFAFSVAQAKVFNRTLMKGMEGEDVKAMQEILARDTAIYPEGTVSGYFGGLTEKALGKFQEREGIVKSEDGAEGGYGIAGPKTREILEKYFDGSSIQNQVQQEVAPILETNATNNEVVNNSEIKSEAANNITALEKPFLVKIKITNKENYRAYAEVESERLAKLEVEYGEDGNFDKIKLISRDLMYSLGDYLDNLDLDKIYSVRAKATDENGLVSYSEEMSFSLSGDTDLPVIIFGPTAYTEGAPNYLVHIKWETDVSCDGIIYYGKTTEYGKMKYLGIKSKNHEMVISGLDSGEWHYKTSCSLSGRKTESQDMIFIVPVKTSSFSSSGLTANSFYNILGIFSPILNIFK